MWVLFGWCHSLDDSIVFHRTTVFSKPNKRTILVPWTWALGRKVLCPINNIRFKFDNAKYRPHMFWAQDNHKLCSSRSAKLCDYAITNTCSASGSHIDPPTSSKVRVLPRSYACITRVTRRHHYQIGIIDWRHHYPPKIIFTRQHYQIVSID